MRVAHFRIVKAYMLRPSAWGAYSIDRTLSEALYEASDVLALLLHIGLQGQDGCFAAPKGANGLPNAVVTAFATQLPESCCCCRLHFVVALAQQTQQSFQTLAMHNLLPVHVHTELKNLGMLEAGDNKAKAQSDLQSHCEDMDVLPWIAKKSTGEGVQQLSWHPC